VLRVFRTTIGRIVTGAAVVVGLYALAGFVIAPKLLRSKLLEEIPKTLNVTPTLGDIRINPFFFQLDLKNFALATPDGRELWDSTGCSSIRPVLPTRSAASSPTLPSQCVGRTRWRQQSVGARAEADPAAGAPSAAGQERAVARGTHRGLQRSRADLSCVEPGG